MALVTPLEYTAVGAVAGVVEVAVLMPSIAIKNALQEGRPVPRSVPTLYRGLGVRLMTAMPFQPGPQVQGLHYNGWYVLHDWKCHVVADVLPDKQ